MKTLRWLSAYMGPVEGPDEKGRMWRTMTITVNKRHPGFWLAVLGAWLRGEVRDSD